MSDSDIKSYFFQSLDEIFETLEEMSCTYDQIQKHSELYYTHNKPEISDPEFDALKYSFRDPLHRLLFQIDSITKFLSENNTNNSNNFIKILNQTKNSISSLFDFRIEELLNNPQILHNKLEKHIFLFRDMVIKEYNREEQK